MAATSQNSVSITSESGNFHYTVHKCFVIKDESNIKKYFMRLVMF